MNDFIKGKIEWKTEVYKTYIKNWWLQNNYFKLREAIYPSFCLIEKRKEKLSQSSREKTDQSQD